jgi:hypothetical protein
MVIATPKASGVRLLSVCYLDGIALMNAEAFT